MIRLFYMAKAGSIGSRNSRKLLHTTRSEMYVSSLMWITRQELFYWAQSAACEEDIKISGHAKIQKGRHGTPSSGFAAYRCNAVVFMHRRR